MLLKTYIDQYTDATRWFRVLVCRHLNAPDENVLLNSDIDITGQIGLSFLRKSNTNGIRSQDFIYVQDLVEGVLLAMEKIETFDPVNIATGIPCTIKEVLNAILIADNYQDAKIVFNSSKPTMIPKRLIDTSKAKKFLGFEAKTSLIDGIKRTVEWYRKEGRVKDKENKDS